MYTIKRIVTATHLAHHASK